MYTLHKLFAHFVRWSSVESLLRDRCWLGTILPYIHLDDINPNLQKHMIDTAHRRKYKKMEFSHTDKCCGLPDSRKDEYLRWYASTDGSRKISHVNYGPSVKAIIGEATP